jgi:hypothetical protein
MKNKLLILTLALTSLFLTSCGKEYEFKNFHENATITAVDTQEPGGRTSGYHVIYISTPKETISVNVGYINKNKFQIGDTIKSLLVLVEKE